MKLQKEKQFFGNYYVLHISSSLCDVNEKIRIEFIM